MEKSRAEVVCILDMSGSMAPMFSEVVSGFASFIEGLKKEDRSETIRVSVVLFNNTLDEVISSVPLPSVPSLEDRYFPQNMTALNDAVGSTIDKLGARLSAMEEKDRPEKVIVLIITDGLENASRKYSRDAVAKMIKHQQEVYSWEFIFLAANQDVFAEATSMNIPVDNAQAYVATASGTLASYDSAREGVSRSLNKGARVPR